MFIFILSFQLLSTLYPLCFWITAKTPFKKRFHQFPLTLTNFFCGVSVVALFFMPVSWTLRCMAALWKVSLYSTSRFYWKKQSVNPLWMSLPSFLGIIVYLKTQAVSAPISFPETLVSILAAGILVLAIHCAYYGYWQSKTNQDLKVITIQTMRMLIVLLTMRLTWDVCFQGTYSIFGLWGVFSSQGASHQADNVLFVSSLAVGTFFPIVLLSFLQSAVKTAFNQETVNFLRLVAVMIFLGELTSKFFLFRVGVVL